MRTKIKRLLRRHRKELAKTAGAGGATPHDLNYYTDLILDQARDMYRYWPEVGDRLFALAGPYPRDRDPAADQRSGGRQAVRALDGPSTISPA